MDIRHDSEALLLHVGWVRALASALVRDAAEADDLTQDVLATALERGPRDPGAPAVMRGWLRRVLGNRASERRREGERRSRREARVARAEDTPSELDTATRLATQRHVVAAVEALEEPFRTAVILRYFDELPPRAIAARLGVPVKTVHSRLSRAHATLRARLEAEHGGDRRRTLAALLALAGPARTGKIARLARPLALATASALALVAVRAFASRTPEPLMQGALTVSARGTPDDLAALQYSSGERQPVPPVPARASLRGRVLTETGEPLANARVELREHAPVWTALPARATTEEAPPVALATSARDGSWQAEVEGGHAWDLAVRASGLALRRVPAVVEGEDVEVRLARAATLVLECRDARDAPCPGARIEVLLAGSAQAFLVGRTDRDGRWRSDEVPPGAWALLAHAADGAAEACVQVAVVAGAVLEQRVTFADGVTLQGTVRSADDGRPIAGAEISIAPDEPPLAVTGTDGCFRLAGLNFERGAWDVRAAAPGFAPASRRVDACAASLDVELDTGWRLVGRALEPDGRGLAGARVTVWGKRETGTELAWDVRETRSGADGAFELECLAADLDYAVLLRAPGRGAELRAAPRGERRERVAVAPVVLAPGLEVSGAVRRADGSAIADAKVLVEPVADVVEGAPTATTTTIVIGRGSPTGAGPAVPLDLSALGARQSRARADGSYRCVDLAPGRYRVSALTDAARVVARREVVLTNASASGIDLVLAGGGTLSGRVLDPERRPLAGAWVLLFREGEHLERRSAAVDGEGRFRFEGLEPERYSVSASYAKSTSGGRSERPFARTDVHDLVPGGPDVEVVLARNVRLGGSVVDGDERPLAGALVNARDAAGEWYQARSNAAGEFELAVPDGSVLALEGSWAAVNGAPPSTGSLESVSVPGADVVLRLH